MQKIFLFLFLQLFYLLPASSQINMSYLNKDSLSKPIVFYGYDFSHVRLIDKKMKGKNMNGFIFKTNKYLIKKVTAGKFARLIEIDTVIFNLDIVSNINNSVVDSTILSKKRSNLTPDSLQLFIHRYNITEKEGTGCVVIFESFVKQTGITSAYILLFNIESQQILYVEHINSQVNSNYNGVRDWTYSSYVAFLRLANRLSWDNSERKKEIDKINKYYTPDTSSTFKPTIFKNSKNELPFTFGIEAGLGPSSTSISGGVHVDADIYHILFGYRYMLNPISDFMVEESFNEQSFYFGYRYRNKRNAVSIASGFGTTIKHCTSGVGGDCENHDDKTVNSVPIFFQYAYYMIPYFGTTFSIDASYSNSSTTIGLMIGIRMGISGSWSESHPYIK